MQNTSIISYFNITANIYNQTLRPSYYVFSIFKMAAVRHLTPAVHCPVTARWHADWSLTTRQSTPAVHCPVTAPLLPCSTPRKTEYTNYQFRIIDENIAVSTIKYW